VVSISFHGSLSFHPPAQHKTQMNLIEHPSTALTQRMLSLSVTTAAKHPARLQDMMISALTYLHLAYGGAQSDECTNCAGSKAPNFFFASPWATQHRRAYTALILSFEKFGANQSLQLLVI
jgi:hypothetical protein